MVLANSVNSKIVFQQIEFHCVIFVSSEFGHGTCNQPYMVKVESSHNAMILVLDLSSTHLRQNGIPTQHFLTVSTTW